MDKELTPKEQKFAELCVTLGNQTEAYRQAYNVSNKDAEWLKVKASQIANKDNVSITIEKLKGELSTAHGITRAALVEKAFEVINDADHTFQLGADNTLSKEDTKAFYRIMNQTSNKDKLRALEFIAKLTGLNEPEKVEHKHTIKTYKTNWG